MSLVHVDVIVDVYCITVHILVFTHINRFWFTTSSRQAVWTRTDSVFPLSILLHQSQAPRGQQELYAVPSTAAGGRGGGGAFFNCPLFRIITAHFWPERKMQVSHSLWLGFNIDFFYFRPQKVMQKITVVVRKKKRLRFCL